MKIKKMKTKLLTICLLLFTSQVFAEECSFSKPIEQWHNCTGTYVFHDIGMTYSGQWKHGKPNGKGKKESIEGDTYVGEFKNYLMHGHGTYVWSKSHRKYIGQFKDNMMHGYGEFIDMWGHKSTGKWKNNKRIGKHVTKLVWGDQAYTVYDDSGNEIKSNFREMLDKRYREVENSRNK